ncbi:hypothetical protein [Aquimarina sp. SS2-1]|uniref:hypothetical protein n=1 Tax=Aquimarina besae TaxID=3342247 RepID=UPI00366C46E6
MKKKGKGSITLSQSMESYDEVFLVPEKVDRVPVFDQVDISATSLYVDYSLTDNFMVIANLPFIRAKGDASEANQENNGFENVREGLQDLSLYTKYRFYTAKIGKSKLDFIGSLGLEFPVGNYEVDEGLQSIIAIGNRSTDINTLGVLTFKHNSGFFATAQIGYSIRNNDVPDAFFNELKLGYAAQKFYVDVYVANQISQDGVDILGEGFNGFFPATQVNYTRIGLNAYVPVINNFGISGGANTYVAGRNVGVSTGFYGGLTYSF